jgi:hypothetical protein
MPTFTSPRARSGPVAEPEKQSSWSESACGARGGDWSNAKLDIASQLDGLGLGKAGWRRCWQIPRDDGIVADESNDVGAFSRI